MDVGPALLLRSPLVFQVGAEPHFPRLERFPTEPLSLEVLELRKWPFYWVGQKICLVFFRTMALVVLSCL